MPPPLHPQSDPQVTFLNKKAANLPMKKRSDLVNPRLRRAVKNHRAIAANLEAFNRCARVLEPLSKRTRQTAIRALSAIYL